MKLSILLLLLLTTTTIHAEITLDGTLGPSFSLTGPDYAINAELGQQRGNNLFHSFENFNLNVNESATFSGANTIQNVISRVTGGNPSNIDGLIRSTIPNADMYLLNPYGIIFGANAKLDVQGSFHASTADYLRFSDGGRFYATYTEQPLLTVAPPTAFGFLSDSPASISKHNGFLLLSKGKTLSFIGGKLTLKDDTLPLISGLPRLMGTLGGKIQLASVASSGEVPVNLEEMPDNAFEKFGKITITDSAPTDHLPNLDANATLVLSEYLRLPINVNNIGNGSVYIRGGKIVIDN